MGDRGNIVVRQEANTNRGDVWFYGHWSGFNLKPAVQTALARKVRWDDDSYLARIVFDSFTDGQQGSETGFGISTTMQDNEYPIVVVDVPCKLVFTIKESDLVDLRLPDKPHDKAIESWTFEQFIALDLTEKETA